MENLARKQDPEQLVVEDVDRKVVRELERCGIPAVPVEKGGVEVPYRHIGKLGDFTFKRAWYYWMVWGPVPLRVAEELYMDLVGKTDIRVGGHCGCPSPAEYGTQYEAADGRRIYKRKEEDEEERLDKIQPGWRKDYILSDDPAAECERAFVESYHIDSELGLYIFVETLRKHGLVP